MLLTRLILFSILLLLLPVAQAGNFNEGEHYTVLADQQRSSTPKVLEFFSFNCPHCRTHEPYMQKYISQKPSTVKVERVPVGFGRKQWQLSAKAYLQMKALKKEDKLMQQAFDQIHIAKQPFISEKDVLRFFTKNGVPAEKYNKVSKSFSAKVLQKRFEKQNDRFSVQTVPYVVVNDIYHIDLQKIKSQSDFVKIVNFLVEKDFPGTNMKKQAKAPSPPAKSAKKQ